MSHTDKKAHGSSCANRIMALPRSIWRARSAGARLSGFMKRAEKRGDTEGSSEFTPGLKGEERR